MLSLYRRHAPTCPHKRKGQDYIKCNCPIWCYGHGGDGKQIRESLKTRDWGRAGRRAAKLESPDAPRFKPIAEAVTGFEQHIQSLEPSTQRKYKNVLRQFTEYCKSAGLEDLGEITVDRLDSYRASRELARTTAQKELETLRQFFGYCRDRDWLKDNPARRIKSAKNIKPSDVVPYTSEEIARILGACDFIGRADYERRRARAMVLLLHHTALRISDVATLARDRVRDGQIFVRTLKTGGMVYLPVPDDLQTALEALPDPRGAGSEPRYFFWNDITSKRAVVGIAERTMAAVFKKSKVPDAGAHRFRHTLATRLLGIGASEPEVADVLGISAAIVRKHYAKWSQQRQQRITTLMLAVNSCTNLVQKEKAPVTN
ncbi:MAG TPA: site-specific integrase [Bryobacteraceae bacterium]|nr:site-specific integrase [Bryobacteraceae bacterium]